VLSEEVLAFIMMQGLPTGDVWLAFKNNLTAAGKAQKCVDILDQLQIFERSYVYDRHGASAYTNPQTSTALFAKKGTGGSKKKDSKATGGGASAESGKASGRDKTIKCFGCGKKGHKKFECRSKHLWKENGSATEAPKEKAASKANIVKVDPKPAATYSESMDFLLLLRDTSEVEEEQQTMLLLGNDCTRAYRRRSSSDVA
jgi:hypothetical protein